MVEVQLSDLLEVLAEDACSKGVFAHGVITLAEFSWVSIEIRVGQPCRVEVGVTGRLTE